MSFIKKNILLLVILLFSFFLISIKITSIPPGLETDETSIAYNAALISKNFRDQNNRLLPIFILSTDRLDWKQPVLIYFTALLFKIFGISLYVYKLSNIIFALASILFFYLLLKGVFKKDIYAFMGCFLFITTPTIFITSRIGNESFLPALICILWLYSLFLYQQNKNYIFLIFNALILGVGLYSFKGMRIIVPIYTLLSTIFIFKNFYKTELSFIKNILNKLFLKHFIIFLIFILPFYLIMPILELKYAGAVFDRQQIKISSIYNFFYYWLSNLSLSFWFTTPETGRVYRLGDYGAIFLSLLPIYMVGVFNAIKNKSIFRYILITFISIPAFFGIAHSVNYSHRLTTLIPLIIILILYGLKIIYEKSQNKKLYIFIFSILFFINITYFYKYYFFNYPYLNTTQQAFGNYTFPYFKELSNYSASHNLSPYVQKDIYNSESDEHKFYNLAYFENRLNVWELGQTLPPHSILLTENSYMEGLNKVNNITFNKYNLLIKP